jgi:hypothetical protein
MVNWTQELISCGSVRRSKSHGFPGLRIFPLAGKFGAGDRFALARQKVFQSND